MSPRSLRLAVHQGDVLRRIHPVATEVTVGRGSENDVVLEDPMISRRHCRLYFVKDGLWIEDLGSANGLFIDGRPRERAPLKPGDSVEIGPFRLTVLEGGEPRTAEESPESDTLHGATMRRLTSITPQGQELGILLTLLESLDTQVPRERVLERICEGLLKALDAQRAFLFRYSSRRGAITRVFTHLAPGADPSLPVSETLAARVAREREPYLVTDLIEEAGPDQPSLIRLAGGAVQSVVVAPLVKGRGLVGVLYLDSPSSRRIFTTSDMDLLDRVTAFLAGLVETIEAREELVHENMRLREMVSAGGGAEVPLERLHAPGSPMERVMEMLRRAAGKDISVLITGETGTGKEVAARALHRLSGRRAGRFIAINCGAIPDTLIESELFGYRKGAFSGADADRPGMIELADGGTLFLDEVGELPLPAQVKLLRVLEERQVTRLGATEAKPVDFRLVAATHRDLDEKVTESTFREDLLYRLKVFPVHMPPLRERIVDLPVLVDYLIQVLAGRAGSPTLRPGADLIPALATHQWPGNLRELRNVLERALVLEDGEELGARALPAEVLHPAPQRGKAARKAAPGAGEGTIEPYDSALRAFQRTYLTRLRQLAGDNVAAMSRLSGISRLTLYRKLGALGLETPVPDHDPED